MNTIVIVIDRVHDNRNCLIKLCTLLNKPEINTLILLFSILLHQDHYKNVVVSINE